MKSLFLLIGIYLTGFLSMPNSVIKSVETSEEVVKYIHCEKPKSFKIKSFTFSLNSISKNDGFINISFSRIPTSFFMQISYDFSDEDFGTHQTTFPEKSNFTDKIYFDRSRFSGEIRGYFYCISPIYEGGTTVFMDFYLSSEKIILEEEKSAILYHTVSYDFDKALVTCYGESINFENLEHYYEFNNDLKFCLNELNIKIRGNLNGNEKYFRNFSSSLEIVKTYNTSTKFDLNSIDFGPFVNKYQNLNISYDDNTQAYLVEHDNFYVDLKTYKTYFNKEKESYLQTHDYYFPIKSYEFFKDFELDLHIYNYGYSYTEIVFPIRIKFIDISFVYEYEIIGEIDTDIRDEDLEEINL